MPKLLIIDDDRAVRESLAEALTAAGFETVEAASGQEGLSILATEAIGGVFLDLRMPGMDGLEVLKRAQQFPRKPPIVVLTAHATAENTIEAMRLGAYDHLTKPIARAELLALAERISKPCPAQPAQVQQAFEGMIGVSPAMREVEKLIGRVADGKTTILISGETGTGKEVVAQAIHRFGDRASKPFVPLNCAAIPAELMESELFGHVKGSFTGAAADRLGAFREADGGILFLDEIGDMPPAMQAKMLRALQEEVIAPVGGKPHKVNVRIVAATHRNLALWVEMGRFRADLLYRLNVVPIHIPPLQERPEDIVPLARHFLAERGDGKQLSASAEAFLQAFAWPGNVRQLKNAVIRAATLAKGAIVTPEDFGFLLKDGASAQGAPVGAELGGLPGAIEELEANMIRKALEATQGNRAATQHSPPAVLCETQEVRAVSSPLTTILAARRLRASSSAPTQASMVPKPATFLLLLAVPPHLRLLAIFIAALALFAALGWLPEFRSALRRWFGERPTVGKTDGTVRNPDMENGPMARKDT